MNKYLDRIRIGQTGIAADLPMLKALQRQHLLNVPFENLDIHWKRPIVLDTEKIYTKIIGKKRGGFCYELNGLFNQLLRHIGFQSRLVSVRVFGDEKGLGPEFDHAAIIVTIGELEYLSDVGFGDFTFEPLRFVADIEQQDREGVFVIRREEYGRLMVEKNVGDAWVPQYNFSLPGRDLSEFAERCDFQQSSPESHFRKGKVCSILTETRRKTLSDRKFIVTLNGEQTETAVGSEAEFDDILLREFNIQRLS